MSDEIYLDECAPFEQEDWDKMVKVLREHHIRMEELSAIPLEVWQTALHRGYAANIDLIRNGIRCHSGQALLTTRSMMHGTSGIYGALSVGTMQIS